MSRRPISPRGTCVALTWYWSGHGNAPADKTIPLRCTREATKELFEAPLCWHHAEMLLAGKAPTLGPGEWWMRDDLRLWASLGLVKSLG